MLRLRLRPGLFLTECVSLYLTLILQISGSRHCEMFRNGSRTFPVVMSLWYLLTEQTWFPLSLVWWAKVFPLNDAFKCPSSWESFYVDANWLHRCGLRADWLIRCVLKAKIGWRRKTKILIQSHNPGKKKARVSWLCPLCPLTALSDWQSSHCTCEKWLVGLCFRVWLLTMVSEDFFEKVLNHFLICIYDN